VAVRAAALLTLAAPALRIVRLNRVVNLLKQPVPAASRPNRADDGTRPLTIARLVAMAARHTPVSNTCLHRSLALWWLLGREGFPSDLVVGARREPGGLAAHAWVEHGGAVINDDPEAVGGYVVFQRTPHA
jgi:hypothetical protein